MKSCAALKVKVTSTPPATPVQTGLLQRKCACGTLGEDEAALEAEGQTLMAVPSELVLAIRALIARKTNT